jgi:hypothetical protein
MSSLSSSAKAALVRWLVDNELGQCTRVYACRAAGIQGPFLECVLVRPSLECVLVRLQRLKLSVRC